jgi:hypothetical protein
MVKNASSRRDPAHGGARAAGVSARTARKWVGRYRVEGDAGLLNRSTAPRRVHHATVPERVEAIAALSRLRMTGPESAEALEMATSTVSAVLMRIGLDRLSRLEREPVRRYGRRRPGELIHIDVKKLGADRCLWSRPSHRRAPGVQRHDEVKRRRRQAPPGRPGGRARLRRRRPPA